MIRGASLAILSVLASLLVLGIASAYMAADAESRVWAFDWAEQVHIGGPASLTPELHQRYELAEYGSASGSLLAARGGDKFRRTARNLSEKLSMDEAKGGAGKKIIDSLSDPKFKGMEKWQHIHRNPDGTNTVIHYVRDPATGKLLDFKFK